MVGCIVLIGHDDVTQSGKGLWLCIRLRTGYKASRAQRSGAHGGFVPRAIRLA